jgi:hypothetical protein
MENNEKKLEKGKQKFVSKYGVWLMVLGLIATIYILKYIFIFFEK